jgi:hypothetical protein
MEVNWQFHTPWWVSPWSDPHMAVHTKIYHHEKSNPSCSPLTKCIKERFFGSDRPNSYSAVRIQPSPIKRFQVLFSLILVIWHVLLFRSVDSCQHCTRDMLHPPSGQKKLDLLWRWREQVHLKCWAPVYQYIWQHMPSDHNFNTATLYCMLWAFQSTSLLVALFVFIKSKDRI